jgi:Putative FMN-binding domain
MLERAEYAMQSMEDVRRLIRDHGWALLVVGSSGNLQAAHLPCLLDPVHDAGGAAEQLVIIGHTARADPRGPPRRGGVLRAGAHGRARRGRPGRPVGAARGRAGLRTADRS